MYINILTNLCFPVGQLPVSTICQLFIWSVIPNFNLQLSIFLLSVSQLPSFHISVSQLSNFLFSLSQMSVEMMCELSGFPIVMESDNWNHFFKFSSSLVFLLFIVIMFPLSPTLPSRPALPVQQGNQLLRLVHQPPVHNLPRREHSLLPRRTLRLRQIKRCDFKLKIEIRFLEINGFASLILRYHTKTKTIFLHCSFQLSTFSKLQK